MTPSLQAETRSGFDGASIAVERSSDEPGVFFVHANGFCKEMWRPAAASSHTSHALGWAAMDQRGHGDSTIGAPPYLWDTTARDALAVAEDLGGPHIGVGHSSGGACLARAEVLAPGTFDRLVLIEPILFPPPHGRADLPIARAAERRRRTFESPDAARRRYAEGPFAAWTPEAIDLYVDHGFRTTDEGWTLKCAPEVEADYFREGNNLDTWEHLHEIEADVTIVVGAESDSHQDPYLTMLVERFIDADLVVIEGAGHLAPMEQPDQVAGIVDDATGNSQAAGSR